MKVQSQVQIKKYLTMQSAAVVRDFVEIETEQDIMDFWQKYGDQNTYLLGGGANTVFLGDYDGLVAHMTIRGKEIVQEDDNFVWLNVAAGEDWIDFVDWTVEQGYLGLENLSMIPGSVGAAPVQNIGAYGVEVENYVAWVEGYHKDTPSQKTILDNDACHFFYRESIFKQELKGRFIVSSVVFKLQKNVTDYQFVLDYAGIKDRLLDRNISLDRVTQSDVALAVKEQRTINLPDWKIFPTSGSMFKNPLVPQEHYLLLKQKFPSLVSYTQKGSDLIKLPAGQLMDFAGFKGVRQGKLGTYKNHALIIVNYADATGEEIQFFVDEIVAKVQDMFGVTLESEVNLVGTEE